MLRSTIALDGQWEFAVDPEAALGPTDIHHVPRRSIHVPGPWQAQYPDLRQYSGVAWYVRRFSSAALAADQTAFFCFGAVDYHATVWLNGQLLGEHEGGYLPFELPAGAALRPGENELVVRVIDSATNAGPFPFAEIPHGKQSWYGPIGGIWQSVRLEVRAAVHLTRLKITPNVAESCAEVAVLLNAPAPNDATLHLILTDPHGMQHLTSYPLSPGIQSYQQMLSIADPFLWDTETPHLYTLEAQLSINERLPDSLSDTFGMRTIATSQEGRLLLNGRPIYLRGALDQDYYPELIYTTFSDVELDAQFAQAKAMGLNCLRIHIKIGDPRYYAAADRAGLLIWTELPNWIELTPAAQERAWETLAGMVERDWNHPSIVIWTIINEGWGVDLAHNPAHRGWLAQMYRQLKALDPHRLIVGNSACFGNFHVVTDIEDFHNYYAFPDHYDKWRDWTAAFAQRPFWSFAHQYANSADWRAYLTYPWNGPARPATLDVQRNRTEPLIVSEFGTWGLPDIPHLVEAYGGEPWWFETGHEWGDGVVYPHGVEQRFRTFHLDKVFGDLSGLAVASQHLQAQALKYQIEQLRRHATISGYVITEFTDVHWECNGLLDIWRRPKAVTALLSRFNADDVIIPDCIGALGWSGATLTINLLLAHASGRDLQGAQIFWELEADPNIQGVIDDLIPEPFGVAQVGTIHFALPQVATSVRTRLLLRLIDAADTTVACNEQDVLILPEALQTPPPQRIYVPDPELRAVLQYQGYLLSATLDDADVALTTQLTDALRDYLYAGGRVVCLAETPLALDTHMGNHLLGQVQITPRKGRVWQGDWASSLSWFRPTGIFADLPGQPVVDLHFADLTPNYVLTGLSPHEFADNVYAGLFVGWVHQPVALVAERPVGAGRLLLSTFRLRDHVATHPLATMIVRKYLEWMGGRDVPASRSQSSE